MFAQNQSNLTTKKTFDVTGISEIEIVPDEIYVSITLQEYKENGEKVTIDSIENALIQVLKIMNINLSNIKVDGSFGSRNYSTWKHKQKEFFLSKNVELKLSDLAKYNELTERLADEGISKVYIRSATHSQIEDYKKQARINAIKNAKEKANYMLTAINEQLGEVIYVNASEKVFEENADEVNAFRGNIYKKQTYSFKESGTEVIGIKLLKISCSVKAVFAIK